LNKKSIYNFPCEDLRTIDQLWVKYSQGRFGFSVQKKIWLEVGGRVDGETECKLGDRIGWRKGGKWLDYDELTFNKQAQQGHLPYLKANVVIPGRLYFFSRIDSFKLLNV